MRRAAGRWARLVTISTTTMRDGRVRVELTLTPMEVSIAAKASGATKGDMREPDQLFYGPDGREWGAGVVVALRKTRQRLRGATHGGRSRAR